MEKIKENITTLDLSGYDLGNEEIKYLCESKNFNELKELFLGENNISDINSLGKLRAEKIREIIFMG